MLDIKETVVQENNIPCYYIAHKLGKGASNTTQSSTDVACTI